MLRYIFITLIVSVGMVSCQKKIDISPKEGESKVVIQGYLFTDSIAKVIVTKTVGYLSTTKPASIGTATVTLSDNMSNTEVLTWNPVKQRYESSVMKGVENNIYTLTVVYDGKTYTSTSVLPHLVQADSISLEYRPESAFEEEGYHSIFYGEDPQNETNYYLFKGYADDSLMNSPTDIYYADDRFISGNVDGIELGYVYKAKNVTQVAKLEFYSLTKEAYAFYNAAYLQMNNDGGFFSTPPANVPSMFDNGAIGLFQCSDIQLMYDIVPAK